MSSFTFSLYLLQSPLKIYSSFSVAIVLDKKQHYSAVFVNLCKAFDSVDHKVLILLKIRKY